MRNQEPRKNRLAVAGWQGLPLTPGSTPGPAPKNQPGSETTTTKENEMTATRRPSNPLRLGRKMRPTLKHRPAIWENMLGTVYAMNEAGEVRYFDYDWDEALTFSGFSPDRDPRTAKPPRNVRYTNGGEVDEPRKQQPVLWITKNTTTKETS